MSRHRSRRRATRLELYLAAIALTLVAGTVFLWPFGAGASGQSDAAQATARDIHTAIASWQANHSDGCPTLSRLQRDGDLAEDAIVDDPWGNRFRVVCSEQGVTVLSPGRDGKLDTADDVRVDS